GERALEPPGSGQVHVRQEPLEERRALHTTQDLHVVPCRRGQRSGLLLLYGLRHERPPGEWTWTRRTFAAPRGVASVAGGRPRTLFLYRCDPTRCPRAGARPTFPVL